MLHHTKTKFIWLKLTAVVANTFCGAKRKLSDDIRRHSLAISDSLETESIDETSSSKDLIPPSSDDSRRSILNNKSRHQKITPRKTSETLSYAHHIPKPLDLKEIKSDAQLQEYLERKQVKPKKNFEDRNKVVLFLRNGFFDFMTKRAVKVLCPLLFLGVGIFFIYQATLIEPDAEQVSTYYMGCFYYVPVFAPSC
ncbi:hypothetical protein DPMN_087481 [Dreissena polymorpha]|uniref:Uncharacterized protein n=1 Tax=Dreissena polymorpha TaxID=45954 RepID=A0A9D4QVI9_DREPO|nr:hypothetical protein DPMN_087481 [Dreissena polymorpha]